MKSFTVRLVLLFSLLNIAFSFYSFNSASKRLPTRPKQSSIHKLLNETCRKPWRCDYTYYQDCDCWLKFHEVPNTWYESQLRCFHEGAILATPIADVIDIMKYIVQHSKIPSLKVFVGISSTYAIGNFFTLDGVALTNIARKWAQGKPNHEGVERCIILNQYGTLVDYSCDAKLPFICYKKYDGKEMSACGTTDINYVFDNRTGSCYKFHRYPLTWNRAYMICLAEGGYLSIINSEKEAQVIRDIFSNFPEKDLPRMFNRNHAFMGYHDLDEHGTWVTVRGQTILNTGYLRFGDAEPDNKNKDQYCLGVNREALLHDLWCHYQFPFICEKDPDSLLCK